MLAELKYSEYVACQLFLFCWLLLFVWLNQTNDIDHTRRGLDTVVAGSCNSARDRPPCSEENPLLTL